MKSKETQTPETAKMNRRELAKTAVVMGAAMICPEVAASAAAQSDPHPDRPGSWPTPRQNRQLTGVQPMAGAMRHAPGVVASLPFERGHGAITVIASKPNGIQDTIIEIVGGRLRCYRMDGTVKWESHPAGLNFESLVAAEDIDGDGHVELALMAGRPTAPLGAAVVVDAGTGAIRFRHDVEPMSYWWTMEVKSFLSHQGGKQIVVCEHAYPPDKDFGYIALFEFERPGGPVRQRWRYDFDHYTCFPFLLLADVNHDGLNELCVETHSHMWVLMMETGKVHQFIQWDVSPANVRSYGLVRFQDLNGDGYPEFFCIADFAQHHELLLNEKGQLSRAWVHGWGGSVTTQTVASTWPDPPIADVDGDGRLEMLVNMWASDGKLNWMTRVYDALTGELKATLPDRVATFLTDVDGDGVAEILADITNDPTRVATQGACLLKMKGKESHEIWKQDGVRSTRSLLPREGDAATKLRDAVYVEGAGQSQRIVWDKAQVALRSEAPPSLPPGPDLSHIPAAAGAALEPPLVADVDGDGRNEVVHFHAGKVTVYRYEGGAGFRKLMEYASTAPPALADLDGDGKLEMVIGSATPTTETIVRAVRPGRTPETLWEVKLPLKVREGLPYGKPLMFQTGRFLGRTGRDVYVYIGTPTVRSLMLDGHNGDLIWEHGKDASIERYFAPTVNLAAVWDVNGDGKDDLVFNCPDYYCVASGPTGEALIGPAFPPKIFQQPSQGLYTLPAILANKGEEPTVCLVDGHYFVAAMSIRAKPSWYKLPVVGEAHAGAEGFLRNPDDQWLLGIGRQNGIFSCLDVATGKQRWEYPVQGSTSAVSACDIDGDGHEEFLFGTSHGDLFALADAGDHARVVWKAHFPAGVGTPVLADVNNDGVTEILVALGDGRLCLLR
ncbi:MAG: hypothetical protein JWL77_3718 [Chthonomonadaceae bacterium]|nr:hypothetical protein [Chthonomonadaceae bacterium]